MISWEQVTAFSNLLLAFKQASRGRRMRGAVAEFECNLEKYLPELLEGRYASFFIHDPKQRLISAAPLEKTSIKEHKHGPGHPRPVS